MTNTRSKQSGLTLIEVMIAMVLGLVLLGGILQVFSSSRLTYRTHEAVSRMQENGRMALEVISRDARMAGFWGCASDSLNVVNNLDPMGTGFIDFAAGGLAGAEGTSGAADSLTIRGGFNAGVAINPPYGPAASVALTVPTGNGLEEDDILLISDCSNADVFQISNADPDTTGQLEHTTGGSTPGNINVTDPGCAGSSAHCLSKIYGADANVFVANQTSYSIGVSPTTGQPTLLRNGAEFLDGIENLQVLYGEDTDLEGAAGFGIANYYVPADQVVDMLNVVSIRFAVVAVSSDDNLTGGAAQVFNVLGTNITPADNRLRQVYTSTVTLRNRL